VITTVDNYIRSYENVITYMNVGTCRYQCATIHKYPVPDLDALWKLKDGTLGNIQFRTARTQTTLKKYPATPANWLPRGQGDEQFLRGNPAGERTDR
jgi:hypothetical protein